MSDANNVATTTTTESTSILELSYKDMYLGYLAVAHVLELATKLWSMSVILLHVNELIVL
jgi:hypothetical protein